MLTIAYCVILNNRLKRLKADEQALKATIAELITATEIAERAVAGLKATAQECDQTLGERLRSADRCCTNLNGQIRAGEVLIERLSRILAAGQPGEGDAAAVVTLGAGPDAAEAKPAPETKPAVRDPKALAAAAQAFAERARTRLSAIAA
jgi:hypothetical protein